MGCVLSELPQRITAANDAMKRSLLAAAMERLATNSVWVTSFNEAKHILDTESPKFMFAPWAESSANELKLKEETKLTLRCYPFEHQVGSCNDTGDT